MLPQRGARFLGGAWTRPSEARQTDPGVHLKFEGEWDESPLAQRTAAFTNSNYVEVPVSPRDMAGALEDTVWHGEKPIFNANSAAKFLLSKAVRDAGIKVVFTGEGADEILAGYPGGRRDTILFGGHHASDTARQASIDQLIAANPMTRSIFFPPEPAAAGTWLLSDALGHCPSWIEGMSCMYIGSTDLMRQDFSGSDDLDAPYRRLVEELDIPHTWPVAMPLISDWRAGSTRC